MSQEQVPEGAPPVDALLEGYTGTCKACVAEADTGKKIDEGHTCPDIEPVRLGEGHKLPSGLSVGEQLQRWLEVGQPGALLGAPECPPGTTLAR